MPSSEGLLAVIPADKQERTKQSNQKYRRVDHYFAETLGVPDAEVYSVSISKPGNVGVRVQQSTRSSRARYLVGIVENPEGAGDFDSTVAAAARYVGPGAKRAAILVRESRGGENDWRVAAVVEEPGGPVFEKLRRTWPDVVRRDPAPRRVPGPGPALAVPLAVDDSTHRMARLAVASSPAVMFVGPPGTGKNRLLEEILDEVKTDPSSYGFSYAHEVVIEPAEEGWTTRDLVGGETIDEHGNLRFRPGRVLDAVAHDRWLVIDEANRADLDRIFGGLLTWLSRQQVVVGRASTKVGAPLVRLGWTDEPGSRAERTELLTTDRSERQGGAAVSPRETVDYWAGREFRLLGTYNALDAQRVFRFGLALGRRFAQVPVPPADPDDFATMLSATTAALDDAGIRQLVTKKVAGLYRAHYQTPGAQIGPGMLLTIPEYVAKGLELAGLVSVEPDDETEIAKLVVEAYLLSTGAWLARLDAEQNSLVAALTTPTTDDAAPLTGDEWSWIAARLPTIGG